MKTSLTYRFLSLFTGITLLIGVLLPNGLLAFSGQMCDVMDMADADHKMSELMMDSHVDCPMEDQHKSDMNHSSAIDSDIKLHDFGFACTCSIEKAPVSTESQVLKKTKTPVIALTGEVEAHYSIDETGSDSRSSFLSDSYISSQPPIFLANESFLI